MARIVLEFSDEDQMRIEAIFMHHDAQEALRFLGDDKNAVQIRLFESRKFPIPPPKPCSCVRG